MDSKCPGHPEYRWTSGIEAITEPLGEEEIRLTKRNYGRPEDAKFLVPDEAHKHFQEGIGRRGHELREAWIAKFNDYKIKYPVSLCVEAYEKLKAEGIKARVVSMPSLQLRNSWGKRPKNN